MEEKIKLEHFRNLVSLAGADGIIQESERIALSKIAFDQGLALDRMNVMLNKSDEYAYIIPQNLQERDKQMDDMIKLAMIDGEFVKAEFDLINRVGIKLGFTPEEINTRIQEHLDNSI